MSEVTVRMFALLGDEEIALGTCHAAHARVLVKREVAAWKDGKLRVIVRPAMLALLDRTPQIIHSPGEELSEKERDRRIAWFCSLLPKLASAVAGVQSRHRSYVVGDPATGKFDPDDEAEWLKNRQTIIEKLGMQEDGGTISLAPPGNQETDAREILVSQAEEGDASYFQDVPDDSLPSVPHFLPNGEHSQVIPCYFNIRDILWDENGKFDPDGEHLQHRLFEKVREVCQEAQIDLGSNLDLGNRLSWMVTRDGVIEIREGFGKDPFWETPERRVVYWEGDPNQNPDETPVTQQYVDYLKRLVGDNPLSPSGTVIKIPVRFSFPSGPIKARR